MYKFGTMPPRKLRDRGVASLLGPDCIVFYDSLFSMMHLGRVTDLLAARLRTDGVDEFKLRSLMLFEFVEAYRAQLAKTTQTSFPPLSDPLVIECGSDAEKVALGVTFRAVDQADFNASGLIERVSQARPANSFEALLIRVFEHADHLVLRVDQQALKFEIVSLIAVPGKFSFEKAPMTLELTTDSENFFSDNFQPTPAKEYVHLGDLDYPTILREDRAKLKVKEQFATGEAFAQDFQTERPGLKNLRVKSQLDTLPEDTFTVKGYLNKSQPFKITIPAEAKKPETEMEYPTHDFQVRDEELQKRELALVDNLKHKDDLIKQVKEQLAAAQTQIEILKKSATESVGSKEETGTNFKQRYLASQRTIQSMQVESSKLELRIDELQRQVLLLQNGPGETAPGELKALKAKHNELMRQHLQLKSMNEQLNARLAVQPAPAAAPTQPVNTSSYDTSKEEVMRKLEITARLALEQAKELKALKEDLRTTKAALEVSQRMLSQKKAS